MAGRSTWNNPPHKNNTTMDVIFDTNIYTRQPALFTIRNWSSGSAFLHIVFWRTEDEKACEFWYALPMSDTSFTVNLIDVFRALLAEGVNFFEMDYETYGEDKVTIYDRGYKIWQYAGTIDPSKVLKPVRGIKYYNGQNADSVFKTWFPSKMIKSDGFGDITFESIINGMQYIEGEGYYLIVLQDDGEEPSGIWAQGNSVQIPLNDQNLLCKYGNRIPVTLPITPSTQFTTVQILSQNYLPVNTDFEIIEQDCRKTYAAVEWVSSFGITRRHVFEVTKQTDNADNVVSLETVGNDWDEHKGQICGCTLRLESLSRYDYWYYADLILSDKAKITFDGSNWYSLQVTAKGYTLPDGNDSGKLNTLEIPVNYCRYDTI